MQWTVLMSRGSSQSIRAWENSLLPPIGAPRIPPEQPFSGIILLGYKLREFDKLDMAANGLFNDVLQTTDEACDQLVLDFQGVGGKALFARSTTCFGFASGKT